VRDQAAAPLLSATTDELAAAAPWRTFRWYWSPARRAGTRRRSRGNQPPGVDGPQSSRQATSTFDGWPRSVGKAAPRATGFDVDRPFGDTSHPPSGAATPRRIGPTRQTIG
jgi:hypothetical protein